MTTTLRRPASLIRRVAATVLAAATLSAAVACSSDDDEDAATATGDGDGNFPVTMEHVYGETVIPEKPEKPEKVVTVGWMTHDIVAALGVDPIGVDSTWGGDEEGFSPWFRHQVEDVIGGDMPEITNKDDGALDIEKIATLEPDLILAPHSGVTDDEYAKLSKIAPTVAYQKSPWKSGSWQDLTAVVAKALGEEDKVADLVSGTEDAMATEAAKYPNLKGASRTWRRSWGWTSRTTSVAPSAWRASGNSVPTFSSPGPVGRSTRRTRWRIRRWHGGRRSRTAGTTSSRTRRWPWPPTHPAR
ncbi:ABC transporter substrate-binding protein [Corynebacterium variabile]|uniref:ABC transporter substrate-binding protein n=1 Tax=Corynebacterium variabile TaxID=1727 RepID=UPI003F9572D8